MAHRHTTEFKQEAVRIALTSGLIGDKSHQTWGLGFQL